MKEEHKHFVRNYYVDESGDGVLFDSKGRPIIGSPGCMNYFILGLLYAEEPMILEEALNALRLAILSDSYFKNIPSMQFKGKQNCPVFSC